MQRGFSLVEVIVATAVMATATIGLAHLLVVSVHVNRVARSTTIATVLALQKMEQLRSMSRAELSSSPSGALVGNTAGYCDFLDANGRTLPGDTSPPAGTVFLRRWAIDPLPGGAALVIQVAVAPLGGARTAADRSRRPEQAHIVGIKARTGS